MSCEVKSTSPEGRFQVFVEVWEARNSLWVESPMLYDAETKTTLLKFADDNWSLDSAEWTSNSQVQFTLRKYPGNHTPTQLVATIDCNSRTARVDELLPVPLEDMEALLEHLLRWKTT
jgi:hypothetical protein